MEVPFERIAVLVRVAGDRSDARDAEVEDRHVVAQLFDPGQDEAAQAAIHVQPELVLQRQVGELADRVDHAVGVDAGGAQQRHRVGRDLRAHGFHIGFEIGVHRRADDLHAQVMGGFQEGRVDGHRRHHFGVLMPFSARPHSR